MQLVLELIAELGISALEGPVRRARRAHPAVIALGLLALGGLVGALTAVLVPQRVLPAPPVPGVSLIVAPVLAGAMMHAYGLWRRSRGERASRLATFWGGAAFAVGFSAARFALLTF